MRDGKKLRGMKHKIPEKRKREKRTTTAIFVGILVVTIFISGFAINSMLHQPSTTEPANSTSTLKAAIVDQLSLTYPNQTFVQTATNTLKQAGYSVDYFPGEEVTVEFYRNLLTHGYNIMILRVHSALGPNGSRPLAFFTSELYSKTKYVYEQLTDQLVRVSYNSRDSSEPSYFGIWPEFIRRSMNGKFQKTIVFAMGCDGLRYTDMGDAIVQKGGKSFIGWFGPVSASHTDSTNALLLEYFLIKKLTLKESVKEAFKELGADPVYSSLIIYYPQNTGDQTAKDING